MVDPAICTSRDVVAMCVAPPTAYESSVAVPNVTRRLHRKVFRLAFGTVPVVLIPTGDVGVWPVSKRTRPSCDSVALRLVLRGS